MGSGAGALFWLSPLKNAVGYCCGTIPFVGLQRLYEGVSPSCFWRKEGVIFLLVSVRHEGVLLFKIYVIT
jgi:hypothetical protein